MGFTHLQGTSVGGTAITTLQVVLGAAPIQGNVVCVALTVSDSKVITAVVVSDNNGKSYTVTPNSPSPSDHVVAGYTYLAYLLVPSGAGATVTASWSSFGVTAELFVDEFTVSGGTASFDTGKDIGADNLTGSTTINTPTITPTGSGELLFAAAQVGQTITSANSPWTGVQGAVQNGNWAEYALSASTATAINFTQSPSGIWSAMAMAFTFTPSAAQQDSYQPIYADYQWLGGDE